MVDAQRYLKAARLWLCGGVVAIAHGQNLPLVRFTVFSLRPVADLTYVPHPNAAPEPLRFFPTTRSPRYEYRGVMPLRFVDAKSNATVATAAIPPEITSALLLLLPLEPAPATGLRFKVAVLDDSAARLAPGTVSIVNLSGMKLTGRVGEREVTLAAGLNPAFALGGAARIVLRTLVKGRSFQAYNGAAPLRLGERALLLLFPPYYPGSAEVQSRLLVDPVGGRAR